MGYLCAGGASFRACLFFPLGSLKIVQIPSFRTHLNFPVNSSVLWVLVRMEGVWKHLEDQSSTTPIRVNREQAAKILQNTFKLSSTFDSPSWLEPAAEIVYWMCSSCHFSERKRKLGGAVCSGWQQGRGLLLPGTVWAHLPWEIQLPAALSAQQSPCCDTNSHQ